MKKNGILPFRATWMDFESVMLSEISQRDKDKNCMSSLICGMQKETQAHRYRE